MEVDWNTLDSPWGSTGKKASDLFPPDVAKSVAGPISTVFETGEPVHDENEVPFQGIVTWRDEDWIPLKTGNETTAVLGISRDITERKRMEQELRRYSENLEQLVSERTKELTESEERYRQLLGSMSEQIAVVDREMRYVLGNDAFKHEFVEDSQGTTARKETHRAFPKYREKGVLRGRRTCN